MSNNQNFIALPGGKECKKVNPFGIPNESAFSHLEYWDFEATNPTYPITEVMPEGETFEGVVQYQKENKKRNLDGSWNYHNVSKGRYDKLSDKYRRTAIKPFKAKEPVNNVSAVFDALKADPIMNGVFVDVVENKETVECKHANSDISVNGMYRKCHDCKQLQVMDVGKWRNLPRNEYTLPEKGMPSLENSVENIAFIKSVAYYKKVVRDSNDYVDGFVDGANWQQSQSIEGIVGFVLEWVAKNVDTTPDGDYDGNGDYINRERVDTDGILNMKSDIIKELKNGK